MLKTLLLLIAAGQTDPGALVALITLRDDMITCSAFYDLAETDIERFDPRASIEALGKSRWHSEQAMRISLHLNIDEAENTTAWVREKNRLHTYASRHTFRPLRVVYEPLCEAIYDHPGQEFANRLPKFDRKDL